MANTSMTRSLASRASSRITLWRGIEGLAAVASVVVACGSEADPSGSTFAGGPDGGTTSRFISTQTSGMDGGHRMSDASNTPPGSQDGATAGLDATGSSMSAATDSAADATGSAPDATAPDAIATSGPDASQATQPDADAADLDDASDDPDAEMGPQVCGFTPCAAGAPCPDLVIDQDDLASSVIIEEQTFEATSCAIVDGCITQTGARRLLRFDTGIANVGTADLTIGNPATNACFQWSQCHEHYHFRGVGEYTLYEMDGTTVAAVGHKQGFCMEDVVPAPFAPGPTPATPFSCTDQGLSVGWEDVYPNDLDCQWVDITGVPSGTYILSVHINAQHYLPESNYDNDIATVNVTVP